MSLPERNEQIWIVSHQYVCALLCIYRTHGFWFTGNQSWNLMKWNACGNVMISEEALVQFLENKSLSKSSKASDFGGIRNARCFVAEHIYPSKELQKLILNRYSETNPSFTDFQELMTFFNKICYVWHEEDAQLRIKGLSSSIPQQASPGNVIARYEEAGIFAFQTWFNDGKSLFDKLKILRNQGAGIADVKREIQ